MHPCAHHQAKNCKCHTKLKLHRGTSGFLIFLLFFPSFCIQPCLLFFLVRRWTASSHFLELRLRLVRTRVPRRAPILHVNYDSACDRIAAVLRSLPRRQRPQYPRAGLWASQLARAIQTIHSLTQCSQPGRPRLKSTRTKLSYELGEILGDMTCCFALNPSPAFSWTSFYLCMLRQRTSALGACQLQISPSDLGCSSLSRFVVMGWASILPTLRVMPLDLRRKHIAMRVENAAS